MLRLKKDDTVQLISGAEKGKRGKVLRVEVEAQRVVVQGVNLRYRHIRRSQKYPQGGRIQIENPIHISNVLLVDSGSDRPVRIRAGRDKDGRKVRLSTRSGKPV
ncbi:MAG: 50S ribosomal protein L24 [Planctomycetota bacterium]